MAYSKRHHSSSDRNSPPIYHSRYVHLKGLNRLINIIGDKYLQKNFAVVDLGCGEAPHKDLIEKHGCRYLPVDIPGNPNANYFVDLQTNRTELASECADVVWSIQVLEHVADYNQYLAEAHRLLKTHGCAIVSTHGQWKYHPDPIDFWRWTSAGLKETFHNHGFEIIEFHGSLSVLSTSIQLFQDAVLVSFPFKKLWGIPFSFLIQLAMLCTEWFSRQSKTLDAHRNIDSDIYFLVAKKIGNSRLQEENTSAG